MNGYSEEQVRLASAVEQLRAIGESATDLYSFVDMTDSTTFDREDGVPQNGVLFNYNMAYSQGLIRPGATACVYITEAHLRMVRARSRAFCALNPYWMAVRENKINYAVGTGHIISILPKRTGKKMKGDKWDRLRVRVMDELEKFQRINRYRRRQGEKLTRLDRDGEYFLRLFRDRDDGVLRVRFVEPLLVQTPPGLDQDNDNVWFGIKFDGNDYEEPLEYYIRAANYQGGMSGDMVSQWQTGVPAEDMIHRTANVDLGSPRGVPSTYPIQEACQQAVSTLKSMGKLVDIRARIAMIRKQINGTIGQIQPLILQNRAGQSVGTGGQLRNVFGFPYGSVIDTNDQRQYEFPSQHIETDKIVHSLKADLQSVAAAIGLADFTISGDSSAAFANALVKEGPMDRAMGRVQQNLIDDDIEVYEEALTLAAINKRLPLDVLDRVRVEIMPPGVIARERLVDTQADEILVRNKAMSPATMSMRANLNPEDEWEKSEEKPSPQVVDAEEGPATGNTRSMQPKAGGGTTARGVPKNNEPGPGVNPSKAEMGGD